MKKDTRNVVLTFSAIALMATLGAWQYKSANDPTTVPVVALASTNSTSARNKSTTAVTTSVAKTVTTSHALSRHYYPRAEHVVTEIGAVLGRDLEADTLRKDRDTPHDVPGDWFTGPF